MGREEDSWKAVQLLIRFLGTTFGVFSSLCYAGNDIWGKKGLWASQKAFIENFAQREEPHGVARKVNDANTVEGDILPSLDGLHSMCLHAGFSNEPRSWFLWVAVTRVSFFATFVKNRELGYYVQLGKSSWKLWRKIRALQSPSLKTECTTTELQRDISKSIWATGCSGAKYPSQNWYSYRSTCESRSDNRKRRADLENIVRPFTRYGEWTAFVRFENCRAIETEHGQKI